LVLELELSGRKEDITATFVVAFLFSSHTSDELTRLSQATGTLSKETGTFYICIE